jgi:stress response protein SCP2
MVDDAVSRGDIGDILPLVSDKGYYDSEYSSIHFMDLMNACKEVPDTAEGRKLVRFAFNQDSDNNMALAFSEKCEANPLYDVVEFIKEKIQS